MVTRHHLTSSQQGPTPRKVLHPQAQTYLPRPQLQQLRQPTRNKATMHLLPATEAQAQALHPTLQHPTRKVQALPLQLMELPVKALTPSPTHRTLRVMEAREPHQPPMETPAATKTLERTLLTLPAMKVQTRRRPLTARPPHTISADTLGPSAGSKMALEALKSAKRSARAKSFP